MSRYDILLNDPKTDVPTKAQAPALTGTAGRATTRPPDEPVERPDDRVTGRGELIRRGFEWYADQLRALKKLSLDDQLQGRPGSMSAMVRDALDEYLKKKTLKT